MTLYNNITEIVGNTPLVKINNITDGAKANVFAKLEFYNPTSTVKDRIGIAIVDAAEKSGQLKPGGTIIEATSDNREPSHSRRRSPHYRGYQSP